MPQPTIKTIQEYRVMGNLARDEKAAATVPTRSMVNEM